MQTASVRYVILAAVLLIGAGLYAGQKRRDDLVRIIDAYLAWNPRDILFRLQKGRLSSSGGR